MARRSSLNGGEAGGGGDDRVSKAGERYGDRAHFDVAIGARHRVALPLRHSIEPTLEMSLHLRAHTLIDSQTLLARIPEYDAGARR